MTPSLAQPSAPPGRAAADRAHRALRARILVLVLTLLVAAGSKPAAQKRSAMMAVRVVVVRACSIDTGAAPSAIVACGSAGPPTARTSVSSQTLNATPPGRPPEPPPVPARRSEAVVRRGTAGRTLPPAAVAGAPDSEPLAAAGRDRILRVITINF